MFIYSIYHLGIVGKTCLGRISKVRLKNWQPGSPYTPTSRSVQKRTNGQVVTVVEVATGDGKVRHSDRGGTPSTLIQINRVSQEP